MYLVNRKPLNKWDSSLFFLRWSQELTLFSTFPVEHVLATYLRKTSTWNMGYSMTCDSLSREISLSSMKIKIVMNFH